MKTIRFAVVLTTLLVLASPAHADPIVNVLSESFQIYGKVYDGSNTLVDSFDLTSSASLTLSDYSFDGFLIGAVTEAEIGSADGRLKARMGVGIGTNTSTGYHVEDAFAEVSVLFSPVSSSPLVFHAFSDRGFVSFIDTTTDSTLFIWGGEGEPQGKDWTIAVDSSHAYLLTSSSIHSIGSRTLAGGVAEISFTVPEPSQLLLLAFGLGAVALAAGVKRERPIA